MWTSNSQYYGQSCDIPCNGDANLYCGGYYQYDFYYNNTNSGTHDNWEIILSQGNVNSDKTPSRRSGMASVGGLNNLFIYGGFHFENYLDSYDNLTYLNNITNFDNNSTDSITIFNDIWKFDFSKKLWILLNNGSSPISSSPSSGVIVPTARMYASAVLDLHTSVEGRIIIYGGYTRTEALGDVWAFDLRTNTWSLLYKGREDNGDDDDDKSKDENYEEHSLFNIPKNRGSHTSLIYNNLMYIFGGASETDYFNDMWYFDLSINTWSFVSIKSKDIPDPRSDHSMILMQDSFIITFGRGKGMEGECYASKVYRDVWKFDIPTKEWIILNEGSSPWDLVNSYWSGSLPMKRFGHSMMSLKQDNSFIIFGGIQDYLPLNDLWRFDMNTHAWMQLTGSAIVPYNRTGFSCVSVDNSMVLFGGEFALYLYFNDIWKWEYNPTEFKPIEGYRGNMGLHTGIAYSSIWGAILFVLLVVYLPRKRRVYKSYSVDKQDIEDKDVFSSISLSTLHHNHLRYKNNDDDNNNNSKTTSNTIYSSSSSPFEILPDELVSKIFSYIDGIEMGRISQVSQRFYALANDQYYWKQLCLQYWQESVDKNTPKMYYINRFTSYKLQAEEARIFRVFAILRSTIPYYFLLFFISGQVYVLGLKLDKYIDVSWFVVFSPLWLLSASYLLIGSLIIFGWFHLSQVEFRGAISRTFPFLLSKIKSAIILSLLLFAIIFFVLLSFKLDKMYLNEASWWLVCAPLLYICLILTLSPIYSLIKNGWSWSAFWLIFLTSAYDLTLVLILLKLESVLSGDWCLLFLPWWISDVFALVSAVSLCMELKSSRLGWSLTIIYSAYMASIITFRSLLCVNLGSTCSDPVGYSWNLILITLQIFIFIFGVPVVVFIRHKFSD